MFNIVSVLLLGGDALAMLVAFAGGYISGELVSNMLLGTGFAQFSGGYTTALLTLYMVLMGVALTLFSSRGHYTQKSPWWEQVKYILAVVSFMLVLAGFVLYALQLPFSRMWVSMSFILAFPLILIFRLVVRKISLCMGTWGVDVTLVGGQENVLETIFALNSDGYNVYNVSDIYLLGADEVFDPEILPARQRNCRQVLVDTDSLDIALEGHVSRLVIFAPDETTHIDTVHFIERVKALGADIALIPPMRGTSLYGMDVQHFFGSHSVLLKPKRRVRKPLNRVLKRGLDVVGATVGMVLLALPILVVALYIRKDGGKAFYFQKRVGRNGKPFKCWKLRSMVPNSKEMLEEILATDPEARKEWETDFKLKNDPRITRIGQVIRKTSVDELPQLWNVLKGEMSLVGPRPIVEKELEYYGKHVEDYLSVKPGLTGLWQVSGRNDTSYAYRVYLDSWYVAHWSVWTDIVIIVLTVGILMNRKGAY